MKTAEKTLIAVLWSLSIFAIGLGAETVRVVSDLGDTEAAIVVTQDNHNGASLSLSLPAVALTNAADGEIPYKRVSLPGGNHLFLGETGEEGKPDMPLLTTFLAIPDQAAVTLEVSYEGYETITDIDIVPTQVDTEEGAENEGISAKDIEFYSRDAFYPGELATASPPAILRDLRLTQITLAPVRYNPVRRELRIYRGVSVRASFVPGGENPKTRQHAYISEGFYPIYRSLVPNFDQIAQNREIKRGSYVILTQPIFTDSLAELARWKHLKGYPVRIVETTEINPNGSPLASQILIYLRNAYGTWENPPEYIMIVGDNDNTSVTGISDYPYPGGYPSDHHYSMLEGTDYLPDVFVGRLSVDNMTDLRRAAAKILVYEATPQMADPEQWIRGLSIGGNVYATTPRITTLWARQILLGIGFTQVDTSFRWSSGQSDPLLACYFDQGVSIVHYRGWSGPSGWYSPTFNVSNLNALQNSNKLGIIISIACGIANFGSSTDPCFGETWIRMGASPTELKGGPAFFGSTDCCAHTKWHNPIMVGIVWGYSHEDAYHFGAAGVRGKMQLYKTFPHYTAPGDIVEKYFNTNTVLGDPELEIRTRIPKGIVVAHPQALPLGVNLAEMAVSDSLGNPIEGAIVTLVKGYGESEEVFKVLKTDATGILSIPFAASTPDTMFVTVSGRDLYPYRGHIIIAPTARAIGPDSIFVDDDNLGYSSGNGDGIAGPGETIELVPFMKNYGSGQIAFNLSVTLEAIDTDLAVVLDSTRTYGDIAPGQSREPDRPFVIQIDSRAITGDNINCRLVAVDRDYNEWHSIIELPVTSPEFEVGRIYILDENNRLDPGDSSGLAITLRNTGGTDAYDVTANITIASDYGRISGGNTFFGDIPIGDSADNRANPVIVMADPDMFNGSNIRCGVDITTAAGSASRLTFNLPTGPIYFTDPTGPDPYGYYMYDNTDATYPPYPLYQWVEIAPAQGGYGTRLSFPQNDDYSVMVELPFDFVYYGEPARKIIVSLNGVISTDTTRFDMEGHFYYNFYNWPIPDPGMARAQISAFWDDIAFSGNEYGVYTWYDSLAHLFVIEWYHMYHRNTNAVETFEMILYDPLYYPTITGDAEIVFQYQTIANNDIDENYSSVGFESFDQTMGIQYQYDDIYAPGASSLTGTRAIKITTNTGRGAISGSVEMGGRSPSGAKVSADAGQYRLLDESGAYWIRDVQPGDRSVTCQAHGFFPQTLYPVIVTANTTTPAANFDLVICPAPANLSASDNTTGYIELAWNRITHADLAGYDLYRSRWQNGVFNKLNAVPLDDTIFYDFTLPDSGVYWYYATAIYDGDGWSAESFESNKDSGHLTGPVGIEDDKAALPQAYFLSRNYPNPFNPSTSISYGLPQACHVRLEVFDIAGRRVRLLSDLDEAPGFRTVVWDGRDDRGLDVSSGVYFFRLITPAFNQSHKMVLIR